jgi:CRISPR system Cascade subunit CasA
VTLSFNLIDQPFLPCLTAKGQVEQFSLLDTIRGAPELLAIATPSPLQTAACYRLLLAVLTSALPIQTPDEWRALETGGHFPMDVIETYLARWHERFDLFHSQRPFYQTVGLDSFYGPIQKLFPERAAGNNDTLFDHTHKNSDFTVDAATAALGLLSLQSFAVGGLVSFDAKAHRSTQAAPVAAGLVVLVRGQNLFETLLLNITRYDPDANEPFPTFRGDSPAWERDEPVTPEDRIPDGFRDLLTFQARRAQLRASQKPDGCILVDGISILKGYQLSSQWPQRYGEPYMAFRRNEDPKAPPLERWLPVRLNPERSVWRDSAAIFSPQKDEQLRGTPVTLRPYHFKWLAELRSAGVLRKGLLELLVFGQATDQASILLWREERLLLPAVFLDTTKAQAAYVSFLQSGLALAEEVAGRLRQAVRQCLEGLGVNTSKQIPHFEQTKLRYWAELDNSFREFLRRLSELDVDEEDSFGGKDAEVREAWTKDVKAAAREAFASFRAGLATSGRALAAISVAERVLDKQVGYEVRQFLPRPLEANA